MNRHFIVLLFCLFESESWPRKNKSAWWIFTQLYFHNSESWPSCYRKKKDCWKGEQRWRLEVGRFKMPFDVCIKKYFCFPFFAVPCKYIYHCRWKHPRSYGWCAVSTLHGKCCHPVYSCHMQGRRQGKSLGRRSEGTSGVKGAKPPEAEVFLVLKSW